MPPDRLAIYLDENHCNNPRVLAVLRDAGVQVEKHLDHFSSGTLDEVWLAALNLEVQQIHLG